METTLNIGVDVFGQIAAAADIRGISRSTLITSLLKCVMNDIPDSTRIGKMVKYQERRSSADWHVFHLSLREDEYEYFLDLRKLFKMSLSLILVYSVKKYLSKMMKKNSTDNYSYKNYVLIRELIDNIISWRILWGYPPDIEHLLPPPI
ncbi:MAG: hypothetical protein JXA07_13190 [Spirochaetes bacterium]|nr:hypothetical protein [Spirochaetota bacterium]